MEEITEGVNNLHVTAADYHKKNRIQVSNTKKPLFFYVNLAKVLPQFPTWKSLVFCVRYMQQYNEVELSALGMGTHYFLSGVLNVFGIKSLLQFMFVVLRYYVNLSFERASIH
ncbi:hypothetical protein B296_00003151 [Ensete ventricosum]|uniref:Uncharacterized protein n=1 Tax=Ensete ventricosum TaxID=4639 RepID=A0A427AYV9_ENSVE|nr:hypothetical protein B296_00003151 [Ensete ventricosum]